jgi:hypothetical protein
MTLTAFRILMTRRMLAEAGVYRTAWPDVALVPTWRPRGPRAIAVGFAEARRVSVPPSKRRVHVEPQTVAAAWSRRPDAMQLWSRVIRNRWGDQC